MSDGATDANHTDHVSELLEGQHVRLWPYFRGVYPRNTLASLWQVMEADQAVEKVFHAQPKYGRQETPYPIRGDLISFVRYFEPDQEGTRLLLVAQAVESGEVSRDVLVRRHHHWPQGQREYLVSPEVLGPPGSRSLPDRLSVRLRGAGLSSHLGLDPLEDRGGPWRVNGLRASHCASRILVDR